MRHDEILIEGFWSNMKNAYLKGYDKEKLKQAKGDTEAEAVIMANMITRNVEKLQREIIEFAKKNNSNVIDKNIMQNFMKRAGWRKEAWEKVGDEETDINDKATIEARIRKAIEISKELENSQNATQEDKPKEPIKPEQPKEEPKQSSSNSNEISDIARRIAALPQKDKKDLETLVSLLSNPKAE